MKIKAKNLPMSKVNEKRKGDRVKPKKPNLFFRTLLKILSSFDVKSTSLCVEKEGMERLGKKTPCLILMNHTSFIDLKIAQTIFYPRPLNIVTTYDGFVGLRWLMRQIGCFSTRKFVPDMKVIKDAKYCIEKLKTSVLMFPEAGYSLDGTATTMPDSLAKFIKFLSVPVVTVISSGAYMRQPLFNNLKKRNVNVSAKVKFLLDENDVKNMSVEDIRNKVNEQFSFDAYKEQQEKGIIINEKDRAEGLDRLLYKCPRCLSENGMHSSGDTLECVDCGKSYRLTQNGFMEATDGNTEIAHVPDWYEWERQCVLQEIKDGTYSFEDEVDIYAIVDTKTLYKTESGRLVHNLDGFTLYSQDGSVLHHQSAKYTYSVNVDYFWYEIGDVVYVGDTEITYCCKPNGKRNAVTKLRLATEEMYKLDN